MIILCNAFSTNKMANILDKVATVLDLHLFGFEEYFKTFVAIIIRQLQVQAT